MSDSVRPHRQQPTRLLCPWDSLGKNTAVGCHALLSMDGSIPEKGAEPRFRDLDSVLALPLTSDLTFGMLLTSLKLGGDKINQLYLD